MTSCLILRVSRSVYPLVGSGPNQLSLTLLLQGTYQFMSVEAVSRGYLFTPGIAVDFALLADPENEDEVKRESEPPTYSAPPKWRHNVLHDLESIWWVAVWAAFTFRPPGVTPVALDEAHFSNLFNGVLSNFHRLEMLINIHIFTRLKSEISYNKDVFERLHLCLIGIQTSYRMFEDFSTSGEAPLVPDPLAWYTIKTVIIHLNRTVNLPNSGDEVVYGNPESVEPTNEEGETDVDGDER